MKMPPLPDALLRRLEPLIRAERKLRERKALAIGLLLSSAILYFAVHLAEHLGAEAMRVWLVSVGALLLALVIATLAAKKWPVDIREIARRIESEHPDLKTALVTALQMRPGEEGFGYLQQRVVADAVLHAMSHDWHGKSVRRRLNFWGVGAGAGALLWLVLVLSTSSLMHQPEADTLTAAKPVIPAVPAITVAVRPGDTEIESGTRLIVEAKFDGGTPTEVAIVLSDDAEGKKERARVPMKATVEAGAFGGMFQRVDSDGFYRVVYAEGASPMFKVMTYVHPALVRADATVTPPAYSGQPVKEVKNTQNISALEGSQVKFRMKVNKPVVVAELYGEDKKSIPLTPAKDDPLILEGAMQPEKSQKYRLHLVDAQDRANKQPPWFNVRVLADQPPKVEIVFPKRDLAVSPIQEMPLEAKVWDDLGVQRSGAVFTIGSQTREVPLSEAKLSGKAQHNLKTMLDLEKMKAEPRQLVSYYVWAEDVSPQGKARRTQSDMFFAEVRHFEDIFREGEASPGEMEESPSAKLSQLQLQVVNADWKLVRDVNGGKTFDQVKDDTGVVKQSQDIVIEKTKETLEKVDDAELKAALTDAGKAMQRASDLLDGGLKNKNANALNEALTPEREALEALYRAKSREHKVVQSSKSKGAGGDKERQLMQLEMKQKEKRYEEEKAAADEKETAEQLENLQVLNRLKELARRQEALAEKIKEVEQQMAQAKTEEQRNELAQQLKRLQEEQEQLLRDVDELKERMEKPENAAKMAEEMRKLEEAREQVRQAAEKLAQQQAGSASNAATRAQENLEKVRDEFRERTAKRFAEELRKLKQDAAGLADKQKKISETMGQQGEPKSDTTKSDLERGLESQKFARQVGDQRESLEKIMEQMRQLSEQAEQAEPLLSTALNDTARRVAADGIDRSLQDVADQSRYGSQEQAQASERKAAKGIEQLQQGVDKAAESVLGSETESLRMARGELDRLLNEVNKDAQQQGAQTANNEKGDKDDAGQPKGGKSGDEKRVAANDARAGKEKGEGNQPGAKSGDAKDVKEGGATPSGQPGKDQAGMEPSVAANSPGKGQQPGKEGQQGKGEQAGEQPGKQGSETSAQGGKGEGKSAEQAQAEGEGKGKGKEQGEGKGKGKGQGQMAGNEPGSQPSSQPGQGQGKQGGPGSGQGENPSGQQGNSIPPGQNAKGGQRNMATGSNTRGGQRNGGGGGGGGPDGGADGGGWFFNNETEIAQSDSPITGANYDQWSDRLRRVEEALTSPELRSQAARVLDNAREMRTDWRRNNLPPQSDTVRMHVVQPLVELRNRVAEELARRESGNPLSPLDRDPVPHRYRELVRQYYKELGEGK